MTIKNATAVCSADSWGFRRFLSGESVQRTRPKFTDAFVRNCACAMHGCALMRVMYYRYVCACIHIHTPRTDVLDIVVVQEASVRVDEKLKWGPLFQWNITIGAPKKRTSCQRLAFTLTPLAICVLFVSTFYIRGNIPQLPHNAASDFLFADLVLGRDAASCIATALLFVA